MPKSHSVSSLKATASQLSSYKNPQLPTVEKNLHFNLKEIAKLREGNYQRYKKCFHNRQQRIEKPQEHKALKEIEKEINERLLYKPQASILESEREEEQKNCELPFLTKMS